MENHEVIWPFRLLPFGIEKIIIEFLGNNVSKQQKKLHKTLLFEFKSKISLKEILNKHWNFRNKDFMITLPFQKKYTQSIYKNIEDALIARANQSMRGLPWIIKETENSHLIGGNFIHNTRLRQNGSSDPENWKKFLHGNTNYSKKPIYLHPHWESRKQEVYFLRYVYNNQQLEELFDNLKTCVCCKSHKYNCPKKIDGYWDEQSIYRPRFGEIMNEKRCKCPCRHHKRNLVNAFEISENLFIGENTIY